MAPTVEVRPLLAATGFLSRKYLFADATPEDGDEAVPLPVWVFYIYHPEKKIQALWDLGIAKDSSKIAPSIREMVAAVMKPTIIQDAAEILTSNGISPADIDYILISHSHVDHIGDPSKFPNATMILGKGTQAYCRPGWPINPDSEFVEENFPDGHTRELEDADYATAVGPWPKAHDFFGDGSVLLIDAPGHLPGHQVALVRTESGRLLLGGDSCHHCAHLTSFQKGGNMSYNLHLDEDDARLNLERIDQFLKEEKDVKLCLTHVGEHNEGFEKIYGNA
ncbi:beta-lactamase-like protein [Morchella snyderi]|nr:beta-lactamase-like protein [Morchella snyderi]